MDRDKIAAAATAAAQAVAAEVAALQRSENAKDYLNTAGSSGLSTTSTSSSNYLQMHSSNNNSANGSSKAATITNFYYLTKSQIESLPVSLIRFVAIQLQLFRFDFNNY